MKPGFGRIQTTFSSSRSWTPQIPTELASVVYAATQANLTGTYTGTGEDGFKWERSIDNGATYSEIGTSGAGIKTFSDTNVSTRNKYMYRFRAYKGTKYSDYSPLSTIDSAEWLTYWQTQIAGILNTTNCPARFDYTDMNSITKDGSQKVSRWNDKLGSGHDLIQATSGLQPVWSDRGILFSQEFMKTAPFAFNQPEEIFMLVKPIVMDYNSVLFDGNGSNSGLVYNVGAADGLMIQAYAGTISSPNRGLVVPQWSIVRVLFDGAGSELQIDDTDIIYWNCGALNMGGFTLAGRADVNNAYMEIKDVLITNGGFSASNKTIINEYLKIRKYLGNLTDVKLIKGAVALTFDDYAVGATGWYTQGFASWQSQGIKVSVAEPIIFFDSATWTAFQAIQAAGHEILNHSHDHIGFNTMTPAEIEADLLAAEADYAAHSITKPTGLAWTTGDYTFINDPDRENVIKSHFNYGRLYYQLGIYNWKSTNKLYLFSVNWTVLRQETDFLRMIDYAKFMKCAVILTNHTIGDVVTNSQIPLSWLNNLIDHAQEIGLDIMKLSELSELMDK